MKIKSILSHAVAKPVIAGLTAGLLDRYFMNNTNTRSNLMFGGAVGAGIFSVSWVEPVVSKLFPTILETHWRVVSLRLRVVVELRMHSIILF